MLKKTAFAVALSTGVINMEQSVAAVFTVSDVDQLRSAIQQANNTAEKDTIILSNSISNVSVDDPNTFGNLVPFVTQDLSIEGAGFSISRDADNVDADEFRFFVASNNATLEISDLTLSGGYLDDFLGGAIYVAAGAQLDLSNVTLSNNGNTSLSRIIEGGAIYSKGVLNISQSTISGNSSNGRGGGISVRGGNASLSMNNTSILDNKGRFGGGVALSVFAEASIEESVISGNAINDSFTPSYGGGLWLEDGASLSVMDSEISNNDITQGGGVFVSSRGTVSFANSTIDNNSATDNGGNIYIGGINSVASLRETLITNGNAADSGGGIFNRSILVIVDSSVNGNSAQNGSAGIHTYGSNASTTISNTTLANNSASGEGGALLVTNSGSLTVANGTISGNYASNNGGGIAIQGDGDGGNSVISLAGSTVVNNLALNGSGGGVHLEYATMDIAGNIISGNLSDQTRDIHSTMSVVQSLTQNVVGSNAVSISDSVHGLAFDSTNFIAASNTQATPLNKIVRELKQGNCARPAGRIGQSTCPSVHSLPASSPAINLFSLEATPTCFDLLSGEIVQNEILIEDQLGNRRDAQCDAGSIEYFEQDLCFTIPLANARFAAICL